MRPKLKMKHAPSARFLRWTPEAIRDRKLATTNLALHVIARGNRQPPVKVTP